MKRNKYYDINLVKNNMNKLFKLNLQLFSEEQPTETETIKILKEEYDKKLEEQKAIYEKQISDLNKNHNEQIRALISGREENLNEQTKKLQQQKEKDLSFEDRLLKDTRERFGLKGGSKNE